MGHTTEEDPSPPSIYADLIVFFVTFSYCIVSAYAFFYVDNVFGTFLLFLCTLLLFLYVALFQYLKFRTGTLFHPVQKIIVLYLYYLLNISYIAYFIESYTNFYTIVFQNFTAFQGGIVVVFFIVGSLLLPTVLAAYLLMIVIHHESMYVSLKERHNQLTNSINREVTLSRQPDPRDHGLREQDDRMEEITATNQQNTEIMTTTPLLQEQQQQQQQVKFTPIPFDINTGYLFPNLYISSSAPQFESENIDV